VWIERVILKDHSDVATLWRERAHWVIVEIDLATRWGFQSRNEAKERALAASRGTDDNEEFPRANVKPNAVERDCSTKRFLELFEADSGHCGY